MQITKRDGRIVDFDVEKIKNAISKAFFAEDGQSCSDITLDYLTSKVVQKIDCETPTVEHVQDIVELTLMENGYFNVSKKYIVYRQNRTQVRDKKQKVHKLIAKIVKDTDRENANVGTGPSAKLLQMAEAEGREFMLRELTPVDILEAMNDNIVYPHDFSWGPIGTTTCTFIPLSKMLTNGFDNGHGWIRSPKRIKTASQLSCIIAQSNQNDQHGGQAYGWFDRDMAPFVKREYAWQLKNLREGLELLCVRGVDNASIEELAWKRTEAETFQAMEGLVFNCNTMHSRAGAQTPFFSINLGTDTSVEGRMITRALLLAYERGLGKGEQPLFPNLIFKIRDGINAKEGDRNFDLFKLSLRVSSKRLFPNYMFQDCSVNANFPGDIPTMGCRTRIAWNVNKPADEQTCEGRGNISFTTDNLVGIALKAVYRNGYNSKVAEQYEHLRRAFDLDIPRTYVGIGKIENFFVLLNEYIDMTFKQLVGRYKYQCSFTKRDFPFLMSGVYMDSEKLKDDDTVESAIKHGTLSIGFIGLAETLKCLTGFHHGESRDADALGEVIIRFFKAKVDRATQNYQLNFSLLATPAEGLSGKFVERDRKIYGVIEGVTDKDWYTNSYHVPVEYPVSVFDKIQIEGKYHKYCSAGAISYIELDAAPKDNVVAMLNILNCMKKSDMSYVAVNFPIDRCRDCGYDGLIEEGCPSCSSENVSRIRRITGYLAEIGSFNPAKKSEAKARLAHNKQ